MAVDDGIGSALEAADDAILVGRASDGDLRAFTALLRRYNGMLRRYVYRLTHNPSDVDDVLQETAIIAWRRLDTLRDPGKVRSWLIQVATREALRHLTNRREDSELHESSAIADDEWLTERLDLRQTLQAALDALPQQQAQCWVLRELGGYRYSEIAAELGIPESTVRGALAQARKAILLSMGGRP